MKTKMKYVEDRKGVWVPANPETHTKKIIDDKRLSEVVTKLLAERRRNASNHPISPEEVLEELRRTQP